MHVYDHCTAIDLIVHKGKSGNIYNVGGHNERSNLEVVKTILDTLGKSEDLISFVADRKGHDLRYAIDASKLEQELGWKSIYSFDEGIKHTIKWYLENQEWMESIISGEYKNYYSNMYKNE
ncbi:dTDP-glucose 4,6-dehydratase [Clostridioides difficile]|nr:dTDP-glucose 4,6-dehydratase [Clostridioides difficile]